MQEKEFIRYLFSINKPLEYPLVWSYIYSLSDDITSIRVSATKLMSIINLDKTKLYRILDYGCDLQNLEFYSRQNHLVFVNKELSIQPEQVKEQIRSLQEIDFQPEDATQRVINKKAEKVAGKYKEAIVMAIDYLNKKAATAYRYDTPKTQTLLVSLFKRHYNLSDIYSVIDYKCNEWLNTESCVYLRPETLFGGKFESYLQASNMLLRNKNIIAKPKQAELFDNEKINKKITEFDENDFATNK